MKFFIQYEDCFFRHKEYLKKLNSLFVTQLLYQRQDIILFPFNLLILKDYFKEATF